MERPQTCASSPLIRACVCMTIELVSLPTFASSSIRLRAWSSCCPIVSDVASVMAVLRQVCAPEQVRECDKELEEEEVLDGVGHEN